VFSSVPWYPERLTLKKTNRTIELDTKWADTGRFTKKIHAALHPGRSTELYQQLNYADAAILTQLRTGKTFLIDSTRSKHLNQQRVAASSQNQWHTSSSRAAGGSEKEQHGNSRMEGIFKIYRLR
jgi:hypothetical protein